MTRSNDALLGTLDLLILRTLATRGPQHGYAIAVFIQEGSLYPALHRMEKASWLRASWRTTETKRRARVYALTPAGRRQLEAAERQWARVSEGVARVLKFV
jgi:transcriptional regulator